MNSLTSFIYSLPASILWLFIIITGLIIGSFLGMLIYRLPKILIQSWHAECETFIREYQLEKPEKKFSLFFPRSFCPHCQTALLWFHNIPILGFLMQKGRCSRCQQRIAFRYFLIEILSVISILVCYLIFGLSWQFLAASFLSWNLIALSFIDIEYQLIPDQFTLPILWLGLSLNIFGFFTDLTSAVIGAVSGYLILWLFAKVFHLLTKKEGMGHGDFKLLAVFGAWLGWQALPFIILCSSLTGAIIGIIYLILSKKNKNTPLPFGPFIALAGWIALLCYPLAINFSIFYK